MKHYYKYHYKVRCKLLSIVFLTVFTLSFISTKAQKVSDYFYGQNAWMPSFVSSGSFEAVMSKLSSENARSFKLIRIGGTNFDDNAPSWGQYVSLINSIRSIGAEPIVQIPISQNVQYAADLVNYINNTLNMGVKFWSIGNEPDLGWVNEYVDGRLINSADDVAFYFTSRASAMKAVDNSIKIFGPDYSFFVDYTDRPDWNPMGTWQYPLLNNNYSNIWGKDANGNYYIDYYAFHVYQNVEPSNVERKLQTVLASINNINAQYRDGNNQLGWAITETHITTNNDNVSEHDKTWNFYAGQHIAQIFGLGMKYKAFAVCPWSIHESGGGRENGYAGGAYDLGFFDETPNFNPRPTYYHEFMLSRKAKWNYVWGYTNNSKLTHVANRDETGFTVLIMNDNTTGGNFTLRLDYTSVSNTYKINIDAGIAKSITGYIGANETQMLFLDASGNQIGKMTYNSTHAANRQQPSYSGSTPDRGENSTPDPTGTNIMIEAEDYYAMSGIQTESCSEGGLNVGWTNTGDWLSYSNITIPTAGIYTVSYRVAALSATGEFRLEKDAGATLLGTISFSPTGGWQTWKTVSHDVYLPAGTYNIGMGITNGGYNLNWWSITGGAKSGKINSNSALIEQESELRVYPNPANRIVYISNAEDFDKVELYDYTGRLVYMNSLEFNNSHEIEVEILSSGVYNLVLKGTSNKHLQKLVIK